MSILDKVAAALTPAATETDRVEARKLARSVSANNDWLSMVIDHHEQLEGLFDKVEAANTMDARIAAQRELGALLTAHSIAEEVVLYPALVKSGEQGQATMAYTQQSTAKTEMFLLEGLDPASQDYHDKLKHIRGAVLTHMYEEEGTWFAELKQGSLEADQDMLTTRFREEFERYMTGVREGAGGGEQPQQQGAVSQQRDFSAQEQRQGTKDTGLNNFVMADDPATMQKRDHGTVGDRPFGQSAEGEDVRSSIQG